MQFREKGRHLGIVRRHGLLTQFPDSFINGVNFHDKLGYGFSGTNTQLKGNTASSNQFDGFDVWFGTATDNVSSNNGRYGFRAVNSLVSNNEASGNGSADVFDAGGLVSPGNNSCHASC